MPRFNDDNTLDDILGAIYVAQGYPWGQLEFDANEILTQIADRIRHKLARIKNRIRKNWFTNALELVEKAAGCYREEKYADGHQLLWQAADQLQSGNKAHRRKTNFIVGPDGSVRRI